MTQTLPPLKMVNPKDEDSVDLKNGIKLKIPNAYKSSPLYCKYESQNPLLSDTQHESWVEDFTVHDSLNVVLPDGEEDSLHDEIGIYCKCEGRLAGSFGIDAASQRIMTEAEATLADRDWETFKLS